MPISNTGKHWLYHITVTVLGTDMLLFFCPTVYLLSYIFINYQSMKLLCDNIKDDLIHYYVFVLCVSTAWWDLNNSEYVCKPHFPFIIIKLELKCCSEFIIQELHKHLYHCDSLGTYTQYVNMYFSFSLCQWWWWYRSV